MNVVPRALLAIQRDWTQLRLRRTPIHQLTPTGIHTLFARLMSLKLRLTRCRRVQSVRARSLRGSLLRAVFCGWRTLIRKLLHIPEHHHLVINHLQDLAFSTSIFDPSNWAIRLLSMDSQLFLNFIPTMGALAPETARTNPREPFWRALKLNLSTAQL